MCWYENKTHLRTKSNRSIFLSDCLTESKLQNALSFVNDQKHIKTDKHRNDSLLSLMHQQRAWQRLFVRDWNDAHADGNMLARQQKEKRDGFRETCVAYWAVWILKLRSAAWVSNFEWFRFGSKNRWESSREMIVTQITFHQKNAWWKCSYTSKS